MLLYPNCFIPFKAQIRKKWPFSEERLKMELHLAEVEKLKYGGFSS